ncbi:Ig-like domain repeat protein [Galbitalea sp. SE-J8]|uniref:OmpL47-type beta-barrel domain-containing protein n=1 Tax=Galbitalea sp. SE-J8 TaxID=3054952 RepID=UPI00259CB941|nr:Ig-like domain repeat protein [Galbitalea sp. SE-J8]MDM4762107.1 Ig-like domain repeat protein [Galbitalea sp. SE-J8]
MRTRLPLVRFSARIAIVGLALSGIGLTAPGVANADAAPGGFTVDKLADSSAQQQRWLSMPKSRLTLNPGRTVTPSDVDRLDTAYFADGSQQAAANVVSDALTTGEPARFPAIDEGDPSPAFSDSFTTDSVTQWSGVDGTLTSTGSGGTLSLNAGSGNTWGHVQHAVSVDVSTDSTLLVDVKALAGSGTAWSVTLGNDGNNVDTLQGNTNETGNFSYDLSAVSVAFNQVQLWVSGTRGESSVAFGGLSIHATPALSDTFTPSSVAQWSGLDATLTSTPGGGVLALDSGASNPWGRAQRAVSVDVSKQPVLVVDVASLGGTGTQWSVTLGRNGTNVDTLQANTTNLGTFAFDLSGVTTSFNQVQLWVNGTRGSASVTVRSVKIINNAVSDWLQAASESTNTWNPQSLDYTGTYGSNGSYTTQDAFVDADTIARIVTPDLSAGAPTLYGTFNGRASWDSSRKVVTLTNSSYASAIAFPAASEVYFFGGAIGFDPLPDTTGASSWAVVLPSDATSAVGFGYAVGDDSDAAQSASDRAANAASTSVATAALESDIDFWNGVIDRVPVVQDFSPDHVSDEGVTSDQVEATYYNAFVSLDMNVLPATPENGSTHAQMPVGKADTYYSPGFTHNTLSAFWDGPLALQQLVYIDPTTAWDIFVGMMGAVTNDPGGEDDGQFGTASEALPSRIAQTAWILYSVTGDTASLETVYPALKRFLAWSERHPQWNNTSHYPNETYPDNTHATWQDERDAEFVASLAVDFDYAQQVAAVLGRTADGASYLTSQQHLQDQYAAWFFPQGIATQFYWVHLGLDGGLPQSKGTPDAVLAGLHVPGLTASQKTALLDLFTSVYDPDAQFAGIATEDAGLKAPDGQYLVDGLLENGQADAAQVAVEAVLRDITRAHAFSENYNASSDGPVANGEIPSTFGISQFIDDVWLMNGFAMDYGTPTFITLPGADGGVSNLTHLGTSYHVDVTPAGVTVSGDLAAQPGICTSYDAPAGMLQPLSAPCADGSVPDVTAPVVVASTSTQVPASGWFTAPVSVAVSASDDDAVDATEYSLDGGEWVSTPGSSASASVSADGVHTLRARAVDASGNVSDVVSLTVRVDSAAPVSSAIVDGSARTVSLRASDDVSGVARIEYRVDASGSWSTYSVPITAGSAAATVEYRAVDVAGNVEVTNTASVPAAGTVLAGTATAAIVAPSRVRYGKAAKVTVRVTGANGIPSGTVRVTDGNVLVGSSTVSGGRASITLPKSLAVGSRELLVSYSGDSVFASSSDQVRVEVLKATSSTTVSVSPKKVTTRLKALVRVKVATVKSSGTVSVTVTRRVHGRNTTVVSKKLALSSTGTAKLRLPKLKTGAYRASVRYAGSSTATGSSATKAITVRRAG